MEIGVSLIFVLQCLISIILGIFITISLKLSGQAWARSFTNVTTYCLLPLIGLVITSVISGNIALSLGMVGALSIIRFRHPVKSPLELSIYFLLLTVGITITSSVGKAIVLSIFSMAIVYSYSIYNKRKINDLGGLPDISSFRNEPQYILDIVCNKKNDFLANNICLLFSSENVVDSLYSYKLAFSNKSEVDQVRLQINNIPYIQEVKYSCV